MRTTGAPVEYRNPVVVVGVDGSGSSIHALRFALAEARRRHATLRVVTVWHPHFAASAGMAPVLADEDDPEQDAREASEQALSTVLDDGDPGVTIEREVLPGAPATVLRVRCTGADILVVGTRGHGRVAGMLLGSVSHYLSGRAPCPVLVVHSWDRLDSDPVEAPGASPAGEHAGTSRPSGHVETPGTAPRRLDEIPEDECVALLLGKDYGRIAVVNEGHPEIFPVNYVLNGRTVAFRTAQGTKLHWADLGHVAFEAEEVDESSGTGWSVEVRGIGRDITDATDALSEHVRALPLDPWAPGERSNWVLIANPEFTGRRLTAI